jgi:hypothetical protein
MVSTEILPHEDSTVDFEDHIPRCMCVKKVTCSGLVQIYLAFVLPSSLPYILNIDPSFHVYLIFSPTDRNVLCST